MHDAKHLTMKNFARMIIAIQEVTTPPLWTLPKWEALLEGTPPALMDFAGMKAILLEVLRE
jgi:hypothetical protein